MKQFNLEEYLKNPNQKVIARDGRNVKILSIDYYHRGKRFVLAEAEGPVIAERLHSGAGTFKTNPGHKSLVVDSGGGTTDLCLLEDEISEENELKFKLLASSDGIGLGGNNIDDAFKDYLLRFISKDLKSDSGINYNELSDQELQKMLLEPYLQGSLAKAIDFENGWLNYKHGLDASYRIPKDYRLWLMEKGHHE